MSRKKRTYEFLIYGLTDPRTEKIRYIGKTCTGMQRPRDHGKETYLRRTERTPRSRWIRSLLSRGLKYGIVVLERFNSLEGMYEAEQDWIRHGREMGWPLTNLTDGGPGLTGMRRSEETKTKIREKLKGRILSPIGLAKLISFSKSGGLKGRKRSPEVIARVREATIAAKKRNPITPETRARMRAAQLGKKLSPEQRARMSASRKGKPHKMSDSWRENVAMAIRSRVYTEEMRARNRAGHIGKKLSAETREKLSLSHKVYWSETRKALQEFLDGPQPFDGFADFSLKMLAAASPDPDPSPLT